MEYERNGEETMKSGKTVKKLIVVVIAVACGLVGTYAAMLLQRERKAARAQVRIAKEELRKERVRARFAPYRMERITLTESQRAELSAIYADIVKAYERRDLEAMRRNMRLLPETNDHITQGCGIGDDLYAIFLKFVRRSEPLPEFNSCADFEKYMRCSLEIAWFYASLNGRRRDFSAQEAMESWVYKRLIQFREKFRKESKEELGKSVERFIRELEAQIESPGGYTRRAIRSLIVSDLDFVAAMYPDSGISWTNSVLLGRGCARGLVRVGCTPKWLDEEYPPLDAKNPKNPELKAAGAID